LCDWKVLSACARDRTSTSASFREARRGSKRLERDCGITFIRGLGGDVLAAPKVNEGQGEKNCHEGHEDASNHQVLPITMEPGPMVIGLTRDAWRGWRGRRRSRLRGQRRRSRSGNRRRSRALRGRRRRGYRLRAAETVDVLKYTSLCVVIAVLRAYSGLVEEIFRPAEAIHVSGVIRDRGDRGLAVILREEDIVAALCARRDLAVVENGDGLLRESRHRGEE
jgi:hypothetical protein